MQAAKNTAWLKYAFTAPSLRKRLLRLFLKRLKSLQFSTELRNPARSANPCTSTFAPHLWKWARPTLRYTAEDTAWARKSLLLLWYLPFTKTLKANNPKTISQSVFTRTLQTRHSISRKSLTPLPKARRAASSTAWVRTVRSVQTRTPLKLSVTTRKSTLRHTSSTIPKSRAV